MHMSGPTEHGCAATTGTALGSFEASAAALPQAHRPVEAMIDRLAQLPRRLTHPNGTSMHDVAIIGARPC
jgi:hypothetical protein